MNPRTIRALGVVFFLGAVVPVRGQDTAGARFEVASLKANRSDTPMSVNRTPGRFTAINVGAVNLLTIAYQIPWFRVVNAPDWGAERFDVVATMPPDTDLLRLSAMLRSLLADRFGFRAHTETREQPVYALVRSKGDARGPHLHQSAVDCVAVMTARGRSGPSPSADWCGQQVRQPGHVVVRGLSLDAFVNYLSGAVQDRVVIDRTGLQGPYDVELTYAPMMPAAGADTGTSLFTALQEQLGLKLEPQRAAVEVLVVDSMARPTPD